MRRLWFLFVALGFALPARADVAPPHMKEFNRQCPAARLCPLLERSYQACKVAKRGASCREFVELMRTLAPQHDCQRRFDHTETVDYIVPAVWVCGESQRENGESVLDEYLELLATLPTPEARRYFASELFRSTLDGWYAELYDAKSKKLERSLTNHRTK